MELSCGTVLPIVVESHQRCTQFGAKTLAFLREQSVFLEEVYVFVSLASDVSSYTEAYPELNVLKAQRGLANVDAAIQAKMPKDAFYILLVDDMRGLKKLHGGSLVNVGDARVPFQTLFQGNAKNGGVVWGIRACA